MTYFLGGYVDLAANASGSVKLTPDVDVEILSLSVQSTGRVEVSKIEVHGVATYLKGVLDAAGLKTNSEVFDLPVKIRLGKGATVEFGLRDLSGATNTVYVQLYCRKV